MFRLHGRPETSQMLKLNMFPVQSHVDPTEAACSPATLWKIETYKCTEPMRLFRQRAFKGEALVPVLPTAYVFVILPLTPEVSADADLTAKLFVDYLNACYDVSLSAGTTTVSGDGDNRPVKSSRPSLVNSGKISLFVTPGTPSAVAVIDVSQLAAKDPDQTNPYSPNNICLDLLDRIANAPVSFDAGILSGRTSGKKNTQFPIAFGGDGRPSFEVGLSAPGTTAFDEEFYELPLCVSCLDRLDKLVSGVGPGDVCRCQSDTCRCLSAAARSCPVCAALLTAAHPSAMPKCVECGAADESTWLCLICGRVGCSRYLGQHAERHFEASGHEFSANIATQQVWDYRADAFTHRMLVRTLESSEEGTVSKMHLPVPNAQSTPNKLLLQSSLPSSMMAAASVPDAGPQRYVEDFATTKTLVDAKLESKVELICHEYTRELAAQLEAQRRHYLATVAANARTVAQAAGIDTRSPMAVGSHQTPSFPVAPVTSHTPSFNLHREIAAWDSAVKSNVEAFESEQEALQHRKELEAEEAILMRQQSSLKAEVQTALLEQKQADDARRARIRQLQDSIEEGKVNLNAMKQVKKAGLTAEDAAGAFTFVEGQPNSGKRSGKRR